MTQRVQMIGREGTEMWFLFDSMKANQAYLPATLGNKMQTLWALKIQHYIATQQGRYKISCNRIRQFTMCLQVFINFFLVMLTCT